LCHFSPQRGGIHEVDEGALASDLDDRQPLAVARLELGVVVDLDLLEPVLAELGGKGGPGAVAEVAAAAAVEDDRPTDRCRASSSLRRRV
jgi:hypothetical protein